MVDQSRRLSFQMQFPLQFIYLMVFHNFPLARPKYHCWFFVFWFPHAVGWTDFHWCSTMLPWFATVLPPFSFSTIFPVQFPMVQNYPTEFPTIFPIMNFPSTFPSSFPRNPNPAICSIPQKPAFSLALWAPSPLLPAFSIHVPQQKRPRYPGYPPHAPPRSSRRDSRGRSPWRWSARPCPSAWRPKCPRRPWRRPQRHAESVGSFEKGA